MSGVHLLTVRSDPGDDLHPRLVDRLESLNLLPGILVWEGADQEWRLPSLSILRECRPMMILSTSSDDLAATGRMAVQLSVPPDLS